jgi:hypothetical protein
MTATASGLPSLAAPIWEIVTKVIEIRTSHRVIRSLRFMALLK